MADPLNPNNLDTSNPNVAFNTATNQWVDMSKLGAVTTIPQTGAVATDQEILPDYDEAKYAELGVAGTYTPETAGEISDTATVDLPNGSKIPLKQWVAMTPAERLMVRGDVPVQNEAMANKLSLAGLQKLDNGETIFKFDYSKLPADDRQYLQKNGIEAFNKYKEDQASAAQQHLENTTVLLDTGERVDREFYNKLPTNINDFVSEYSNPQQLLQTKGVDAFNKWADKYQADLKYNAAAAVGANLNLYSKLAKVNPKAAEAYVQMTQVQRVADAGLGIIRQAKFQAENIQVGPKENNEWIKRSEYNKLTPQMQTEVMNSGLAALDISGQTSWQKLETYKRWGLVSPNAVYMGESSTPGEPAYTMPAGAIDWDKVQDIAAADSSQFTTGQGRIFLNMVARMAATKSPELINTDQLPFIKRGNMFDRLTSTQQRNLDTWWDNLSQSERQEILNKWRNAPKNIQELAESISPNGGSALPYEQNERIIQLTDMYGNKSFAEFATEAGGETNAINRITRGVKELFPTYGRDEETINKIWDGARPELKGKILAASLTTQDDRDEQQFNDSIANTQKWLSEKTEWVQEHIAGGSNPVEQAFRGFASGVMQLSIGTLGLGVTELDVLGSVKSGSFKVAGQKLLSVPMGILAAGEAQIQRIGLNPVTGVAEAAGMLVGGDMLLKLPKTLKSGVAVTKVIAQKTGIQARAISGPDYSAFYVEPPKGIDLLASDIKELVAQNKELAHEILYNPKSNKLSFDDQVRMLEGMLNEESKLRLNTGIDIVKDIANGPGAPKSMIADPIDVLSQVATVPNRQIAKAIVEWAKTNPIEIGGSTAELAQAKGIKEYHTPNDVDYYVLKGSIEEVAKRFIDEIGKVVGKKNVRVIAGKIEIKYKGEWINHGSIHTTTDFGEGLPFGVKPKTVKIDGITFMDYREQALRRFRSIITPTGEGRTGVELAWREKDYVGWDRIVELSNEVLKQRGSAGQAEILKAKADAFDKIPSGRKLSFDDYLVGKTGITVRELVKAVGEVQEQTLTAEAIEVRPPKSAEILSGDVNKIIDAEIEKAKDILYSGKYSRDQQVAWIKSRLAPEERVRVETLTNILKSITDGPAMPKTMIRRVTDAFDMIDGNPGKIVSNPLKEWFKQNSAKVAVGGRVAVNLQNKGSKFAKVAGDLDIIVLDGDVGATARSLADSLNKSLGNKGEALFGQLDKYSGLVEVWIEEFGQYMRIELHEKGMYEPHMPYGARDNYIVADGIKFQDLRSQLANRVDSVLHLKGLGQVDVRWAGRLKDFANLDREMSTYAEGLAKQGRVAQAKALNLQIKEFSKLPRGEEIPLDKYIENSSGIEVGKFIKGAPKSQLTSMKLHSKYGEYTGPSSYDLIRNTSPMSRMMPDVLYMATRSRDILRGFDKDGKIIAGKMYDENGRAIKAPRPQLYGSINAAMNYLIDPITGKVPPDALIMAVRITKDDIGHIIKMATRAEPLGIEKGIMRRGVLDEGTLEPGEAIYPTAPNARSFSKRGVSGGRTGETVTNFSIYGRTIPVVWARTANALKAGLETPDEGLLRTAKILAIKESFRDLLHPHLPKHYKVSTSNEPIPSSSIIRFGKTTYEWRKGIKNSTPAEISKEVNKLNSEINKTIGDQAKDNVKTQVASIQILSKKATQEAFNHSKTYVQQIMGNDVITDTPKIIITDAVVSKELGQYGSFNKFNVVDRHGNQGKQAIIFIARHTDAKQILETFEHERGHDVNYPIGFTEYNLNPYKAELLAEVARIGKPVITAEHYREIINKWKNQLPKGTTENEAADLAWYSARDLGITIEGVTEHNPAEYKGKFIDIREAEQVADQIYKEIIDDTFKQPEIAEYIRNHTRDAAELQRLKETYVINLRKILDSVGLKSAILSEALAADSVTNTLSSKLSNYSASKLSPSVASGEKTTSIGKTSSASSKVSITRASGTKSSGSVSKTSLSESYTGSSPSASEPSKSELSKSGPSQSELSRSEPTKPSKTSTTQTKTSTTELTPSKSKTPPITRIFKHKKESASELSKIEQQASVAWNQGKLKRHGKLVDQYIIIHPPYTRNDKIYTTKVPALVPIVDGPRSAYDTIRNITGGNLPPEIWIDMGVMDVKITAVKEVPSIKFMPDRDLAGQKGHIKILPRRSSAPRVRTAR